MGCTFEFDPVTGLIEFQSSDPSGGLTCVTFIVLVFKRLYLPVVVEGSWPVRPDDALWRASVIQALLASGADPNRMDRVKNGLVDPRIRPEELVGSFIQRPWPVSFDAAHKLVREVIADLEAAKH